MNFNECDDLKNKLDEHRPLAKAILERLHEDLVLRWTYNSNAIEGNTLTLKETKVALEGITVGGKTLREHFEAINHRDAIEWVESLITKNEALSEQTIRNINKIILTNIDDINAGAYRNINVTISGAKHIPPEHFSLSSEMSEFIKSYQNDWQKLHPIERSANLHIGLVKIHPFIDGNGRTSRLIMNFELMRAGFPAIVIPFDKRLAYYEALDKAHTTLDSTDFYKLTKELVIDSFKPYFFSLGI